jgi:hypothetical protein
MLDKLAVIAETWNSVFMLEVESIATTTRDSKTNPLSRVIELLLSSGSYLLIQQQ